LREADDRLRLSAMGGGLIHGGSDRSRRSRHRCCHCQGRRDQEAHRRATTTEEDLRQDCGNNDRRFATTEDIYHHRYHRPPSAAHRLPPAVCRPLLQLILVLVVVARYCLNIPPQSNAIVHHLHLQTPSSISAVEQLTLIDRPNEVGKDEDYCC